MQRFRRCQGDTTSGELQTVNRQLEQQEWIASLGTMWRQSYKIQWYEIAETKNQKTFLC